MKINIGKFQKNDKRTINVQIDKFDTWNLDHTLALIILPALIQLKATKHGVPAEFADYLSDSSSMQHSFDFVKEDHDWAFEARCRQWDEILDKMIWSFQQLALEDYEQEYHHGEVKFDWKETNESFYNPLTNKVEKTYEMIDTNPSDHWYDIDGHQEHERRIQEGLELFGKYYRHLWD